jgi:hypothetical protein
MTTRILCMSFSPIHTDARVLRQLAVLARYGEVTTLGYGPAPTGATYHLELSASAASLPQTPVGVVRLGLRRHAALELTAPGERAALRLLAGSKPYDLVVANDARALPLAHTVAGTAPIWADLHEWAPDENTTNIPWRILVKPYMDALCRRYLPHVAAVSTVGRAIAELYRERYGVDPVLVRNAGPKRQLVPTPLDGDRIRLVHSGVAVRERNIEALIDATAALDERFTLDLYLMGEDRYADGLRARAAATPRVTVHPPVRPDEIPSTLNRYDLGVYLLPLRTLNHRLMLPNKFFDFVQARIGIVMSPAEETARLIADHGLGPALPDTRLETLVTTLRDLRAEDVEEYKRNAHIAAPNLSSEEDVAAMSRLVERLIAPPSQRS